MGWEGWWAWRQAAQALVGAAADQREQRRFVLAWSPQLWQGVPSFWLGEEPSSTMAAQASFTTLFASTPEP